MVYQVHVGDGFKKKRMKRTNSFFKTPGEAISEALAFKEKMDVTYQNEIIWDYTSKVKGTVEKMKILKGYLKGDKKTDPFYLQITSVELLDEYNVVTPRKPKKITTKDKKVVTQATKLFV
ncbi:hypothetical protein IM538_02460 [Cytobacillus suaedae]|nr:hypothetical protein IM538_02460 [Cytobacillus suaedae]